MDERGWEKRRTGQARLSWWLVVLVEVIVPFFVHWGFFDIPRSEVCWANTIVTRSHMIEMEANQLCLYVESLYKLAPKANCPASRSHDYTILKRNPTNLSNGNQKSST